MLKTKNRLSADSICLVAFLLFFLIGGFLLFYYYNYNDTFTSLWRIFIFALIFVCIIGGWYYMMRFVFIWAHYVDYENNAPKLKITKQFVYKNRVVRWCDNGMQILQKDNLPICIFYNMLVPLKNEEDCIRILDKCKFKEDHVYFDTADIPGEFWFYRVTYTNKEK